MNLITAASRPRNGRDKQSPIHKYVFGCVSFRIPMRQRRIVVLWDFEVPNPRPP